MAAIKYVNILNSVVSEEGSGGFLTNYIYYSLLIAYTDGTKKVVTVRDNEVSMYMPYVRTPVEELQELCSQMSDLKGTVKALRQEINELTDQKMQYVVESLYPIPELVGLTEESALQALKDAGLSACITKDYEEGLPRSGVVLAAERNKDLFKVVNMELVYPTPNLSGMSGAEATALLESEKFQVTVVEEAVADQENDLILSCEREDERNQNVVLKVTRRIPSVIGLNREAAEQILKAAGFEPIVKRVIMQGAENNQVLSSLPDPQEAMAVVVEYAADPDDLPIKGLKEGEALEYLNNNGVSNTVIYRFDPHPAWTVYDFKWSGLDGDNQQLAVFISKGLEVMNTSNIKVNAQNMQGSAGDRYSARATYNQTTSEMRIHMEYTVNAKNKHKLYEIRTTQDSKTRPAAIKLLSSTPMETGVPGSFEFGFKTSRAAEKMTIILVTQFGLMNKTEEIRLDMDFSW